MIELRGLLIIVVFSLFPEITVMADKGKQKIDTTHFEVAGVCDMCKERIENAALIRGIKYVNWDKESDMLQVIYRTDKADIMDVHRSIAESGHATSKVPANEEAYRKLPGCCAYLDGAEKH